MSRKHIPRHCPFVRGIHLHRWIPLTKETEIQSFSVFFAIRLNTLLNKRSSC